MLETPRLLLRPFQKGDEADLFAYLHTMTQHCFLTMRLEKEEQAQAALTERMGQDCYLAIVRKEDGKVMGEIFALPEATDPEESEIDNYSPCWMLGAPYRGKGYGYEAARAYLDFLFREKGARRVYMYTEDTNLPCQRLCEKLGARREGLFIEYVSFIKDEEGRPVYENTCQYAILRKEWIAHEL